MRIGLARVSTHNRAQDTSIAAQEKQLLDAGCDQVITVRESAFKGPRKGWHELRSLVASGKVSEVLCIDQSRLARDGTDLEFLEECAVKGVVVRALTGGVIETATVGGFVQAGVFSVMNQAYSRQLSLKVKDGLDRRKAQGHYASGRVPFGYAYVDGLVVPHPDDWPVARQMFLDLLAAEMNIAGYVREHRSKWTTAGLRGWLQKPILRGIVKHQAGGVKPLISAEEWSQATHLLARRSVSRSTKTRTLHLLTGLVRCQQCGKNLKHKMPRYGARRVYCANPSCDWHGRGIAVPLVRQQLVLALREQCDAIQSAAQLASGPTDYEDPPELIEARSSLAALMQMQESGVVSLGKAISDLRRKIDAMTAPVVGPDWRGLSELLAVPGVLDAFTDAELRPLVLDYIAEIVYLGNPGEVEIRVRKSP